MDYDGEPTGIATAPTVMVTKTTKLEGKTETAKTDEVLAVRRFESPPATVTVSIGATKNLGNYESAKILVAVSKPCYPEEIEETYQDVKRFVEARVREEVEPLAVKFRRK